MVLFKKIEGRKMILLQLNKEDFKTLKGVFFDII